jgi:hypothetical protein
MWVIDPIYMSGNLSVKVSGGGGPQPLTPEPPPCGQHESTSSSKVEVKLERRAQALAHVPRGQAQKHLKCKVLEPYNNHFWDFSNDKEE